MEEAFTDRMFLYNARSYDLYRVSIASYAVLADDSPNWKPESFYYGFGKSKTSIEFGVLKMMDYIGREEELEKSDNLFALAILAHLMTLQTKRDPNARYFWKLRLARILFKQGWERKAVESLFGLIDWLMRLPQHLEDRFEEEILAEEEENNMALISPREKIGLIWAKKKAKRKEERKSLNSLFLIFYDFVSRRFLKSWRSSFVR